jgi:hypothetical protein
MQTQSREVEEDFSDDGQSAEAEAVVWLPPRDSNPDMLIQSQMNVSSWVFLEWVERVCKLLSFLRFSPAPVFQMTLAEHP